MSEDISSGSTCRRHEFAWIAIAVLVAASAPGWSGVSKTQFGLMPDGRPVYEYTLKNRRGTKAQVISLGATLRTLR